MTGPGTDFDALAALHASAFSATGERPWDAGALRALATGPGAILEAGADGFALLRLIADEAEVLTLAVKSEARRRGVGRGLMVAALARATALGARRVFLEVAEDNGAARALYGRLGFADAGRRPGYYGRADGTRADALLLVLNLPHPLP